MVAATKISDIQDPANHAGPYDFAEKNLHENVTIKDYFKIGTVFATLPFVVGYRATLDQAKFRYNKFIQNPRYEGATRSFQDSIVDCASEYLVFNLNWKQLRVLLGVRPIREELNIYNCTGLNHYNYYFGGDNYSARWLHEIPDRTPNDPVILYMHGGSYALKTQVPQLDYMTELTKELGKYRVSTLVLDYTIGAALKHPAQLEEGLACYEELSKSCSNIIAFGDSCGGHLALAMLLSGVKFSGCMLVSPTTDLTGDSYDETTMRQAFVDGTVSDVRDPLLSPIMANEDVWSKVLPENTAMVWGSVEECVRQMKEFIDASNIKVYFEEVQGGHDCILRGRANPGSQFIEEVMHKWLSTPPNLI